MPSGFGPPNFKNDKAASGITVKIIIGVFTCHRPTSGTERMEEGSEETKKEHGEHAKDLRLLEALRHCAAGYQLVHVADSSMLGEPESSAVLPLFHHKYT